MSPVRGRRWRPFGVFVALALVVGTGGWLLGHTMAEGDRAASAEPVVAFAPVPTTASTTTTSTVPHQVAGRRLPAGAATVFVLGDSVALGAQSQVSAALVGWDLVFDAKVSRRIDQGLDIVAAHPAPIARVLVVHLCTNWSGGDYHAMATRLLEAARGVERVVWMTCTPWRPEVQAADDVIRALPAEFPQVVVADWSVLANEPGYTAGDHLHLNPPGAVALASLISGSIGPAPAPS